MYKNQTKIRLLKSLNHPKLFSLYKISVKDLLDWKDDGINFKYHSEIKKVDILSISKCIPGGLNFEPWIKIEFMKNGDKNELFITSRRSFGFGSIMGDNEEIEKELKLRYLNNE